VDRTAELRIFIRRKWLLLGKASGKRGVYSLRDMELGVDGPGRSRFNKALINWVTGGVRPRTSSWRLVRIFRMGVMVLVKAGTCWG